MKKELNYIDHIEKNKNINLCERAFQVLPRIRSLLQEYGIKDNTTTIRAALNAKLVEKMTDAPKQPNIFNPNESPMSPKLQVVTTEYEGCDAIRKVYENRLKALAVNQTKIALQSIKESIETEYQELMWKICDTFPKGLDAGGQYLLAPIAIIDENGDLTTRIPIDKYCEELATKYVSTEKGIVAKNKVNELCGILNEIKDLFKPYSVRIDSLVIDDGDSATPTQIDYDKYFTDN